MQTGKLLERVSQLIELANQVIATKKSNRHMPETVDEGAMVGLRASSLSFILMTFGDGHTYYKEFDNASSGFFLSNSLKSHAILSALKTEIEQGWIYTVKKLVAAEIFTDFLEMAEHLIEQGYKDPASVMIGSVLEENLRHLCIANKIDINVEKDGDLIPKKADRLNSELAKASVYSLLDQKSVTAWLDLRNKAAHGKYDEYSKEQVSLMLNGVTDFLARMTR